jgi:pilus assembly protein CpaE
MTALNPNETMKTWQARQRETPVPIFLAEAQGDAPTLVGTRIAGFGFALNLLPPDVPIDPAEIAQAPVALVQVSGDSRQSVDRFRALVATGVPIIAAAYEPSLKFVRELILLGAHDVLPLPVDAVELERSLGPIRERLDTREAGASTNAGKVVAVLKSVGGVGATSLITQTAISYARRVGKFGREAGLIDLDVQFGDAAFQLGLRPKLSLAELVDAGTRLDGDLLRATIVEHPSGLKVAAAPPDMMPLESLSSEAVLEIVELAAREFGTLFVDLPTNWTNWSMSIVARADVVLMVTEMTVSCLHRARRQLDLLRSQDLGALDVRVVVNRVEKGLFKSVGLGDVEKGLGREVAFTIANDHPLMRSAIDRGVPLADVKTKSALGRDIDDMAQSLAVILEQEG